MARLSPAGGIVFLFQHPLVYLYNTLIIFTVLSISMLFRHRIFALTILSLV
jgi:hypothetical protein